MKEKIDELTERNKSLEAVNLQLRSELAKARGEEPEIPPETDTPLESQPEPEPPPETEPAPSDVPPAIEPANTESKEGFRTRWNRLTGRLGSFMLGRQAAVHNGVYSYVDRRGRKVVVDEEVVDGYPESNRRAGAYALIGAIGAVALVGIAYWLGTRGHNGPDIVQIDSDQLKELSDQHIKIENNQQEILEKINQGVINPDGTGIGGFEREYLGGTLDNHSIAVDLPRGANLIQNAGGKYDIVGPGGNIWVKNIEWDRQGNLAEWVRSSLTNKNLEVAQHHLTYLDNHGPGRHGLVKHFVTAISTKG